MSTSSHVISIIVWVDAAGGNLQGWRPLRDVQPFAIHCISTGCVIRETKRSVTIAPHCIIEDGQLSQLDGEITIPKGWVVSRKEVAISVPKDAAI